jgi:hypothetical protein
MCLADIKPGMYIGNRAYINDISGIHKQKILPDDSFMLVKSIKYNAKKDEYTLRYGFGDVEAISSSDFELEIEQGWASNKVGNMQYYVMVPKNT